MATRPTRERLDELNAMPVHRRATAFRLLRECCDAGELSWEPGWKNNMIVEVLPSIAPSVQSKSMARKVETALTAETSPGISGENPVNHAQACELLAWSATMMSAIKKAMGITGRYFFLSDVRKFIRDNPNFQIRDSYPRKSKARANRAGPQSAQGMSGV